ncbi:hypothetical protein GCM10007169_06230 [Shewanella fodinae]|nr:hypothetical protein GCM10007169_06230 [Shewanella fodinae]
MLAGNAVTAALLPHWLNAMDGYDLCLMKADVEARGLMTQLTRFRQIDYAEFVALTLTHHKVISW